MMATLFGVDPALLHRPVDRVEQVGVHGLAPLLVGGVQELLAVAGGAAEVHLHDGVAAVGEPLRVRVEAPACRGPRGRRGRRARAGGFAAFTSHRQGQVAVEREAVAGRERHGAHLGERQPLQLGLGHEEERALLGLAVPGVVAHRSAVLGESHQPGPVVAVPVHDAEVAVAELPDALEVGPHERVDDRPGLAAGREVDRLHHVLHGVDHHLAGVDVGVLGDDRLGAGGDLLADHPVRVGVERGGEEEGRAVGGDVEDADALAEGGGEQGLPGSGRGSRGRGSRCCRPASWPGPPSPRGRRWTSQPTTSPGFSATSFRAPVSRLTS